MKTVLILFASAALANAQEILVNGSFENGFTGWSPLGTVALKQSYYGTAPTDGKMQAAFGSGQSPAGGLITQSFPTTPGATYGVTFDLGAWSLVNQNAQSIKAEVFGAGPAPLTNFSASVNSTGKGAAWIKPAFRFVANSALTKLVMIDTSPTSANVDLLLDNVRIAAIQTATPVLPPPLPPPVTPPVIEPTPATGPIAFGQVKLSWEFSHPTNEVSSYTIYHLTPQGRVKRGTVTPSENAYTMRLALGTNSFLVTASNAIGESADSVIVSINVQGAPAAPTGVEAVEIK